MPQPPMTGRRSRFLRSFRPPAAAFRARRRGVRRAAGACRDGVRGVDRDGAGRSRCCRSMPSSRAAQAVAAARYDAQADRADDRLVRAAADRRDPREGAPRTRGNVPLAIAFHVPWDAQSGGVAAPPHRRSRLGDPRLGVGHRADHRITTFPDTAGRAVINGAARRPLILPMIQNAVEGKWDGPGMAALLHDPTAAPGNCSTGSSHGWRRTMRAGRSSISRNLPPGGAGRLPRVPERGERAVRPARLGDRDGGAGRRSGVGPAGLCADRRSRVPDGL